jgi:5-methylcytosine-specific restriction endonuclease McrA
MSNLSWSAIRKAVYERADGLCEYCQTSADTIGQAMHVEHINPNGDNDLSNLCLSCSNCNQSKAKAITGIDPQSDEIVPLFNPRTQQWHEHFIWLEEGLRLFGLTATGRATIERLKINQDRILVARIRWIKGGFHPPR